MLSNKEAKDELRITKLEMKRALKEQKYYEFIRHCHYKEFLEFVLNWKEGA